MPVTIRRRVTQMLSGANLTAHSAPFRTFAWLAAMAARTPTKMVIVCDRTDLVIVRCEVNGSIGRAIAANHCSKLA